jgi:hypothetical protein
MARVQKRFGPSRALCASTVDAARARLGMSSEFNAQKLKLCRLQYKKFCCLSRIRQRKPSLLTDTRSPGQRIFPGKILATSESVYLSRLDRFSTDIVNAPIVKSHVEHVFECSMRFVFAASNKSSSAQTCNIVALELALKLLEQLLNNVSSSGTSSSSTGKCS